MCVFVNVIYTHQIGNRLATMAIDRIRDTEITTKNGHKLELEFALLIFFSSLFTCYRKVPTRLYDAPNP